MINSANLKNSDWTLPKQELSDIVTCLLAGKKIYVFVSQNQQLEGYATLDTEEAEKYSLFLEQNKKALFIQEATNQYFEFLENSFNSMEESLDNSVSSTESSSISSNLETSEIL